MVEIEGVMARRKRKLAERARRITVGRLNSIVNSRFEVDKADVQSSQDSSVLFEGRLGFQSLGSELQIHMMDALAVNSTVSSAMVGPAINVLVLLEGNVTAAVDGVPLNFSALGQPCGYIWSQTRTVLFEREVQKGQHVRKVNISFPIDWLNRLSDDQSGMSHEGELSQLCSTHLLMKSWKPTASSIRCSEDILAAHNDHHVLNQLAVNMWAYQILFDALSQLEHENSGPRSTTSNEREYARVRAARDYINRHISKDLNLDEIARGLNMSVTTLQRLFKNCYGTTVIQYVRTKKLTLARHSLIYKGSSISQAAYFAGYNSASNFSTAFHREFGYSPSQCINAFRTSSPD